MAVYAIGDLQGCLDSFEQLLDKLALTSSDKIWLTGDLVNRGPKSLETLRFVKSLGDQVTTVLGNHDLHLLALAAGRFTDKPSPTLKPILQAEDRDELLDWLRARPLMHVDNELGWAMVHAGVHPEWDIALAKKLAEEVESVLRSSSYEQFMEHMYGNHPNNWQPELAGNDRLRFTVNVLTRIRFCDANGKIDFLHKGALGSAGDELMPWFDVFRKEALSHKVVFGHWSALGLSGTKECVGIDTGCLWGSSLTAMRLDHSEHQLISVECPQQQKVLG